MTNLNFGKGFPCASHGNTIDSFIKPTTASNLDFGGSLGGVKPTGSERKFYKSFEMVEMIVGIEYVNSYL